MEKKKSMSRVERLHREKVTRYSIRKVSFGAASVAVAALFMFLGNGAVSATEQGVPSTNGGETQAPQPKDQNVQNGTYEGNTVATSPAATVETNTQPSTVENSPYPESAPQKVETLDKKELTDLIKEIDGKFAKGTYATKTEESVNNLRDVLEAAKTALSTAKTQSELSQAHANLIVATTKLQTKPEEKKEAPAVDTTNGKATVGIKATNTEKSSESNSIANSGSKDERNGKALDTNNPFRTGAATTNTDPAANQTYTAPADDADLNTLVKALLALDPTVENNSKLSQNMDSLGDSKEVAKGTVKEITEFGGWTAVDGGVFAIARRTEEGVYPLETINSTLDDTVWLQEQAFDRDTEYTLLLSKSRTRSNRDEVVYDNSTYKPTGEGGGITKNLARYKGIEKTFKAYSTKEGSDVIVKFKPGYVGDSEGRKARYKVEVYSIEGTTETKIYETTFDPSKNINDAKQVVTAAKDGTNKAKIKISDSSNSTTIDSGVDHTVRKNFIGKREAEKLMAQPGNKPNGTAGTFTSKPIALPQGADHYKVRVSLADQDKTGMSYQAWDDKYSVPVTGADFSIAQDTSNVARNLLQRIYDKLKATESADKNGKTSQTIQDYEAELEKVRTLLANPAARTPNFKQALQDLLAKQSGLKTDKTGLTNSKAELDALVNEDPTPGKTTDTAKAYNAAKEAAKTEIAAALTVINDDNATPEQVSAALEKVNAKKTALQEAKDGLIEAATAEEKAKLKSDADSLVKADTTGKTPKSIEVYNTKYEAIKAQLEAAKTEAAAVLAKENNASKAEAQAAQEKVDAAKAEVAKAAIEAVEAIQKAETQEAVNAAQEKGEAAIKAVNPVGKEKALDAIQTATEAKLAEIDKNTNLSADEKAAAKAEVAKAAIEAVEAIQKATTQEAVNAAQAKGETAIKAVNPVGKEKALEAIKATRDAKLAEIDKATGLSAEEKAAAKAAVEKAYNEAVEAIQKAATQEAVNAAQAKGEAAIKAVNSIGKEAVNEAKAAVEAAAAEKIASIKANPNLSAEEKAKAIAEVERLKQTALNAIDKATTKAELDKALRTFLYQLDLESLVYDRPTFDLEAYIQASITGVVKVERGKAITQADIIAKLNLPENVTVISIDLPDTNTLGDKFAKVTLRLPDGTEVTVKVPVRVVAPQNGDSKPDTSLPNHGANNGTTNTDVKVDKAKLEGAIRQLDELIIQESAKLDAETAKEANDLLADAKKVFANADASQAEVDAMVKRIEDFMAKVAPSTDHATPANDQAAQTPAVAPSTTQAAANASQTASAQANTRTVAKELPNTGTADSVVSMVAAAASALLGLGLAGRRKEDEEA